MRTTAISPVIAFALVGLQACAHRASTAKINTSQPETDMETNRDRAAINETVHNIARGADLRQWETVRASFASRVVLDYGTPELLTPDEIVKRWQPLLSAFDSTQHVLRDDRIELLEQARARAYSTFQATHHLVGAPGGDIWTLSGRYEYELVREGSGWKVSRMRMVPGASSGNVGLLATARERAGLTATPPAAVVVERVTFEVEGQHIVGNLYLPANARPGARLPGVALFGTWTSTKEMIVPSYANLLAPAGFAVLTIDFRGFGESEGAERRTESASRKVRDIRGAVDFLARHPRVDAGRIGAIGICAGSGYLASEVADDPRVRSLVLVAPWLHNAAIVEAVYGGAAGVADKNRLGEAARRRFQDTGVIDYVPAASNTDRAAAMFWEGDALDYYLNVRRGGIPQWGNQFAVMAWPEWLAFDGVAVAPRVHQPTLIVHAETAAIPQGAHQFAAGLPTPPRQVWLEGPTQFDFYDSSAVVSRSVAEAIHHLNATLSR
jgi:uncharacterized protein